ncbi:aminopeptidase P family protein [Prolixibacter sp. NT017]|uniref:aminopeptidase P family protein n=1 Tax=Prolixibacter sp. NT017 TaxID=2652390 RepID=UPI0012779C12|nr:aminopeptidase P family protein [Prolixibacter sp. NT017]GET25587.1 Xaa-Pro aminopeptidase [Prolixibacter sp. NT017]
MTFPIKTYTNRRKELARKVGSGIILLLGNEESPMNYTDNTFPFRQDSTFLYYFGIDFPGLAAVIDIEAQQEIVFGDDYTIDDIVWRGPQPTIADRLSKAGVKQTLPLAKLAGVVDAAMKKNRKVHFLPPYRPENRIKLMQLLGLPVAEQEANASVDLIRAVVSQREIKTEEEIGQLEHAVNISVDMHIEAMRIARPGMQEAEVAARCHEVALAAGGDIGFPIIATINGQTLHNHYHGNTIKEGDLLLLDAGAENTMHYNGDLSSTFPVSTTFSAEQKDIYLASLLAYEAAIAAIAPGTPFRDVHLAACRSIVDSLKQMGLMKGDVDEAVEAGAHALFFPCGTGHMMGLDVHDMEDLGEVWVGYDGQPKSTQFGLKSLRLAKPLQAGHVFTIEPGIYFIPELMDWWQASGNCKEYINWDIVGKFRHAGGYRNEENFVVTEDGFRRLGKAKPKTIEEIEMLRYQY